MFVNKKIFYIVIISSFSLMSKAQKLSVVSFDSSSIYTKKLLSERFRPQIAENYSTVKSFKPKIEFLNGGLDSFLLSDLSPELKNAFTSYVRSAFGNTELSRLQLLMYSTDSRRLMGQLLDKKVASIHSLVGKLNTSNFKKLVDLVDINAQAESLYAGSEPVQQNLHNMYIKGEVVIAGINFNIQSNYGVQPFVQNSNYQNFHLKMTYEKEGFVKSIRKNVEQRYDLTTLFLKDVDVETYMMKFTQSVISSRLKNIRSNIPENLRTLLRDSAHFHHLMQFDSSQMLAYISDQHITVGKAQIDSFGNYFLKLKDSLQVGQLEVNRVARYQQLLNVNALNILDDKRTAENALNNIVPLSGIQRLFLQVQQLRLGNYSPGLNKSFNPEPLLNNGANVVLSKALSELNINAGAFKSANSYGALPSGLVLNGNSTQFLSASFNTVSKGKISVIQSLKGPSGHQAAVLPKNSMSITMLQEFNLGKLGSLSTGLSKSANNYNNTAEGSMLEILERKNALSHIGDDFWQTLALSVRHQIDLPEQGLYAATSLKVSGLGYQSPLSNGLNASRWELGTRAKKSFLKRRLVISFRYNMKDVSYSLNKNRQLMNYAYQMDSRYRYSRSHIITLRWFGNQTFQQAAGRNLKLYGLTKMEAGSNVTYRIGTLNSIVNVSAGLQKIGSSGALSLNSTSITSAISNSLILKSTVLSLTAFLNKEINSQHVIGDMITSDVSLQYPVSNKLSLNSAVVYLSNSTVAKQIGVRQGWQLMLSSKVHFAGYADVRSNLRHNAYPGLYSNCRGNISVMYNLN